MFRIISASKDTMITDKIVAGSRSLDANTGQAGTLDLFKLFNETTLTGVSGNIVELSRLLLQFDYSQVSGVVDIGSPSFTASLVLKDVYGGQTVPSNYTLALFPLSKSFDEGRGFDVVAFRDIDTANFLSASTAVTWSVTGAGAQGALGADVDINTVGDIGSGVQNLGVFQTFTRGDEDAKFNVTSLVSASIAGVLPNNGFRISYTGSQEEDSTTRFVKRFGSRHTFNKNLRPALHIEVNDEIYDSTGNPQFNVSQSFFTYNNRNGNLINFFSGSSEITGDNSLLFELIASKSVSLITSSWQPNFSASITHATRSVVFFSQSFSASQYNSKTGIYTSNFILDLVANSALNSFVSGASEIGFDGRWKSLDGAVIYAKSFFDFTTPLGGFVNSQEKNYVVNAVNLKDEYTNGDEARIRVFVQDIDMSQTAYRFPTSAKPVIIQDMRWRLKKSYSEDIIIPFARSTRMSTDSEGMYFDLFIQDLDINEVYELEFLIRNDLGKDVVIQNKGFIFKVTP